MSETEQIKQYLTQLAHKEDTAFFAEWQYSELSAMPEKPMSMAERALKLIEQLEQK